MDQTHLYILGVSGAFLWLAESSLRVVPQKFIKGDKSLLTHILGSYGIISGVNCLNVIENIANFKRRQCLSKDEGFKKEASLMFLRDKENPVLIERIVKN